MPHFGQYQASLTIIMKTRTACQCLELSMNVCPDTGLHTETQNLHVVLKMQVGENERDTQIRLGQEFSYTKLPDHPVALCSDT